MKNINKLIDHTLLKADATEAQILELCKQAKEYEFATVMVNGCWVKTCADYLERTDVLTACVIGFPLGAMSTYAKVQETKIALQDGAQEIDMVINIGKLKDRDEDYVVNEIQAIKSLLPNQVLKVIIETALLTEEEKILACDYVSKGKADYIKTSTGFSTHGATEEDVVLLRKHVNVEVKVKAAGGIRTYEDLKKMVDAGAERVGASAGIEIIKQASQEK